jgi:hypothetical protein
MAPETSARNTLQLVQNVKRAVLLRSFADRWVGHEIADLLSTPSRGRELPGPLDGGIP